MSLVKKGSVFLILFFIYLIVAGIILYLQEKGDLELFINRKHHVFFDYFFRFMTYFGEGLIPFIFLFILLFSRLYHFVYSLIAICVASLISQIMKRAIFEDSLRPKMFFRHLKDLYYIEGLEIHSYNSFPSGHTTGAFATFFLPCADCKKQILANSVFYAGAHGRNFKNVFNAAFS